MNFSIWDFDGPAANTYPADLRYHQAEREPYKTQEQIHLWKRATFKQHLVGEAPTHQEWQEKIALILEYNSGILRYGGEIRADVMQLLDALRRVGWQFGLVTNGTRDYVRTLLAQAEQHTRELFDPILTIQDHHSKSHRILQTCKQWGVSTSNVSFVTDTANDVLEALRVIPIHNIIGVAWGPHTAEDLQDAGCHTVVDAYDPEVLVTMLEKIHRELKS
jgi:phosphoglycolate phosphatase-like HAD superfamily hydrolase